MNRRTFLASTAATAAVAFLAPTAFAEPKSPWNLDAVVPVGNYPTDGYVFVAYRNPKSWRVIHETFMGPEADSLEVGNLWEVQAHDVPEAILRSELGDALREYPLVIGKDGNAARMFTTPGYRFITTERLSYGDRHHPAEPTRPHRLVLCPGEFRSRVGFSSLDSFSGREREMYLSHTLDSDISMRRKFEAESLLSWDELRDKYLTGRM